MSGGIWISFVNLSAFSFEFDRVRYVSVTSDAKLVRLSDLSFTENIVSPATFAKSRMSGLDRATYPPLNSKVVAATPVVAELRPLQDCSVMQRSR